LITVKGKGGEIMRDVNNPRMGRQEFGIINHLVRSTAPLFADAKEGEFFRFICDRTLAFGKYGESIKTEHFAVIIGRGFLQVGPGVKYSSRHRRKMISSLVDRGLVMRDPGAKNFYLINLPGMARVWTRLLKPITSEEEWEKTQAVLDKMEEDFDSFPWASCPNIRMEYDMALFEKEIGEGLEKSQKSQSRKRLQRTSRPSLRVNDVVPFIKECCEDHGLTYSEDWTAKNRGMLRNWLKACVDSGADERVTLQEVVKFWPFFRTGSLVRDDGSAIVLRETVSFMEFYNYRQQIGSWLLVNRNREPSIIDQLKDLVWEVETLD
jgi:hypothetical protein